MSGLKSGLKPLVLIPKAEHTGSGNITVGYTGRLSQIKQSIKVRKQQPRNAQYEHIR